LFISYLKNENRKGVEVRKKNNDRIKVRKILTMVRMVKKIKFMMMEYH